ncbi:MAG: carboxylating nicotinate-nucleotide diphosphorylase [Gemmatimonadales bacterium]
MLTPDLIAADALRVARVALAEDGDRDITSEVTVAAEQSGHAEIEAREGCVLAGRVYADAVTSMCGLAAIGWVFADGADITAGRIAGTLDGSLRGILRAERSVLNLLQRATGIATMTRRYVDAVAGTGCRVLHTRKTTPGLRIFEVHAVLLGGGTLHRLDLARTVMVKDNHWQALARNGRPLAEALAEARNRGVVSLQVEVESLTQLDTACAAGATRLLIDNQTPATVAEWSDRARSRLPGIEIEATGGITLSTIRSFAEAGADFVSTGALTHSVKSVDLGLEIR